MRHFGYPLFCRVYRSGLNMWVGHDMGLYCPLFFFKILLIRHRPKILLFSFPSLPSPRLKFFLCVPAPLRENLHLPRNRGVSINSPGYKNRPFPLKNRRKSKKIFKSAILTHKNRPQTVAFCDTRSTRAAQKPGGFFASFAQTIVRWFHPCKYPAYPLATHAARPFATQGGWHWISWPCSTYNQWPLIAPPAA